MRRITTSWIKKSPAPDADWHVDTGRRDIEDHGQVAGDLIDLENTIRTLVSDEKCVADHGLGDT